MINAISWAGIMMLFNYCTWNGNLLSKYRDSLERSKYKNLLKPFGSCLVCTGFWFGLPVWFLWSQEDYFVFLGWSEGILVLYSALLIKWFK